MVKLGRKLKYAIIVPIIIVLIIFMYHTQRDASVHDEILSNSDNLNGPEISMDDPRLIQKIKRFLLKPPNINYIGDKYYKLTNPEIMDPSMGQAEKIRKILQNRKNGFFIEVGALDGEIRSNTLYFERYLNWTGLLIEPDPLNFEDLLTKNRRSWLSPTCLSIQPYPVIELFEQNKNMGKIAASGSQISGTTVNVQCFPLYTYLLALNVTHVDYFSLDVEGSELEVLKTIPFKDINIETLSVEFVHVPGGKDALSEYMFSQGYIVDSEVTHPNWLANDFIFVKM